MELEVIQLSKATNKDNVDTYKCTMKGNAESGHGKVKCKLTLSCEDDPTALDDYVDKVIGSKRILALSSPNRTLDEFGKQE